MLSHVFAGSRSGEQGGSSDYVPNGQPTFRPVTNHNHTNQRHNRYGLAGLAQASSVQTLNNVVNRGNPGNHTETESMANQNHWYQPPQPSFNFVGPRLVLLDNNLFFQFFFLPKTLAACNK